MPMTNAEMSRRYRIRKKAAKSALLGQEEVSVKRPMTSAERSRAFRLRKKMMNMPEHERQSCNNGSSNVLSSTKTKKRPMTSAERSRAFRLRKKMMNVLVHENQSNNNGSSNVLLNPNQKKRPLTSAERSRACRLRKKVLNMLAHENQSCNNEPLNVLSNPIPEKRAMTSAESNQAWRLRKKKMEMSTLNNQSSNCGSSNVLSNPDMYAGPLLHPVSTTTIFTNSVSPLVKMFVRESRSCNNAPLNILPKPKKRPMTSTERNRAWRLRKKKMEVAVFKNQSCNYESSNVLSNPDMYAVPLLLPVSTTTIFSSSKSPSVSNTAIDQAEENNSKSVMGISIKEEQESESSDGETNYVLGMILEENKAFEMGRSIDETQLLEHLTMPECSLWCPPEEEIIIPDQQTAKDVEISNLSSSDPVSSLSNSFSESQIPEKVEVQEKVLKIDNKHRNSLANSSTSSNNVKEQQIITMSILESQISEKIEVPEKVQEIYPKYQNSLIDNTTSPNNIKERQTMTFRDQVKKEKSKPEIIAEGMRTYVEEKHNKQSEESEPKTSTKCSQEFQASQQQQEEKASNVDKAQKEKLRSEIVAECMRAYEAQKHDKQPEKSKPKTPTERSREFRARQRLLGIVANMEQSQKEKSRSEIVAECLREYEAQKNAEKPEKPRPKTTAERVREYRARKRQQLEAEGRKEKPKPKTSAERMRDFRARRRLLEEAGLLKEKPKPKSSAERVRRYRARKRQQQLEAKESNRYEQENENSEDNIFFQMVKYGSDFAWINYCSDMT